MSSSLLRPLGFGEILDGGFVIYRRHFTVLFATALLALLPSAAASAVWIRLILASPDGGVAAAAGGLLVGLVTFLSYSLIFGALVRQVAGAVSSGEVSIADGWRHAIRRFVPLSVAFVLSAAAAAAGMFVVMVPVIVMSAIVVAVLAVGGGTAPPAALPLISVILLAVLLSAVVLLLMAGFFAIAPAVVLETRGPIAAIGRSWTLARGAWARIVGVLLVSTIIITLPSIAVAMLTGGAANVFDADAAARVTAGRLAMQQTLGLLTSALTLPFFVACTTVLYFDRRVRTEAYDLEAAAEGLPMGS